MCTSSSIPPEHEPTGRPSDEQFVLLTQIIRGVARRKNVGRDDELDFGQYVHLRLLEADYKQLGQFAGRSSLRTYLHVVVQRMYLDWRRSLQGKWRPSAAAKKLGAYGTQLDRLIHRDGHTVDEAIHIIDMQRGAPSATALRELAAALPARDRLRMVPLQSLHEDIGMVCEDPIEQSERRAHVSSARHALALAFRKLPVEDRKLLALRFHGHQRVAATAAALRVDAKVLYRRYQRLFRDLRRTLEASGVVGLTSGAPARASSPLLSAAWRE